MIAVPLFGNTWLPITFGKRRTFLLVLSLVVTAAVQIHADELLPPVQVCFTPSEDCTGQIVAEIGYARQSLLVQAYSFTSATIAKALAEAKKRGVDVRAILDKSQRTEKYSSADFLVNSGVPVLIDAQHAIAHNKVIVIDGETVLTGSFNFTKAAQEKNAENLLILRDRSIAARYTDNWRVHESHAEPYTRRAYRAQ